MGLCVNSMTVHEVMCEQWGYANETKESSKRKMEKCKGTNGDKNGTRKENRNSG